MDYHTIILGIAALLIAVGLIAHVKKNQPLLQAAGPLPALPSLPNTFRVKYEEGYEAMFPLSAVRSIDVKSRSVETALNTFVISESDFPRFQESLAGYFFTLQNDQLFFSDVVQLSLEQDGTLRLSTHAHEDLSLDKEETTQFLAQYEAFLSRTK